MSEVPELFQKPARGWTYDAGDGQFIDSDGKRIRGYRKLLALVPGMTLDHLSNWEDDRQNEFAGKQTKRWKRTGRPS